MKVILRSDIVNVGRQGEIKEISDGFARNYLIPKSLVMEADEKNLKIWEKEKIKLEKQRESLISEKKELAEKIEKISLTITVKVGENGKLFGAVTVSDIAEAFEEKGFKINKHDILLAESLKEVGAYTVNVRLHPEVTAQAKVWVVEEKIENNAEKKD
ncbi:MAG: 50S ribosomal protein L9 [Elusimicrobia bacterium]|nr:50S ribosomal protein L9 [Elusimicrobiota bacterium]